MLADGLVSVVSVSFIDTKRDMSMWTRAHSEKDGLYWSVLQEGGRMAVFEHAQDRREFRPPVPPVPARPSGVMTSPPAGGAETWAAPVPCGTGAGR